MTVTDLWREGPVGFIRDTGNEQPGPLPANGSFTGQWRNVGDHAGIVILYATTTPLATCEVQWSKDGVNPDTDAFRGVKLRVNTIGAFQITFSVQNILVRPFFRIHVVNGPTDQLVVYPYVGVLNAPWTGTFNAITDPLSALSVALLTRSVLIGDSGGGNYAAVKVNPDQSLTVGDAALAAKDFATQATLAALLAKLETGLAKDASLAPLASQATLAAVLAKLESGLAKDTTLALRPSQFPGRTHVDKSIGPGIGVTTTIHTVTAGKKFYLTSLVYSVTNLAAALGQAAIRDNTTVKIPFTLPLDTAPRTPGVFGALSFAEPVPFTTSVVAAVIAGTVGMSFTICGYEE